MTDQNLPSAILKEAWCRVRLDAIQAAVKLALARLEELDEQGELSEDQPAAPSSRGSAAQAALVTCIEELRRESGIAEADAPAECPHYPDDPRWVLLYDHALNRYRNAAAASLRESLGEATVVVPNPHTDRLRRA